MLIEHAAARGIAISEQTFIDIVPVVTQELIQKCQELFSRGGTMVFTSPNAVRILSTYASWNMDLSDAYSYDEFLKRGDSKVYCLNGATSKALEELIPGVLIAGTAANSKELAELIISEGKTSSVVFFCGNIRRNELPDMLRSHNITVEEVIVYETVETPAILEEEYDGILFLSPSSVKSFFLSNTLPKHTICFAIGGTTGKALADVTNNRIIESPKPHVDLLVQTAIFYFDNINCYE